MSQSRIHLLSFFVVGLMTLLVAASLDADERGENSSPTFSEQERSHWAYQPVARPGLPPVRERRQIQTPIDAFLLARLESEGLKFQQPTGKRTLLRRAKFDLLGLPPTPEEIERFLSDESPDAYRRLVDRLLASPHYGEKWGRSWLDLVRFAETAGFNADPPRPLAYKYRDYIVRAFNQDTPYNRFVQEQLAGDELFPDRADALIATGFNLMWPDESNASNVELARQDALNDLTANVGAVFFGLTIGCAQCHDHKFDPIPQKDFYQLQAFFVGIVPKERVPLGTPTQLIAYRNEVQRWLEQTASVRDELHEIERAARAKAGRIKRLKFPAVVLAAIDTAPEYRTARQHQLAFWSERQIVLEEKQLLAQMNEEQKKRRPELKKLWAELLKTKPKPPAELAAMAVGELASGPPPTHLLAGGSYNKPTEEVSPDVLSIVKYDSKPVTAVTANRPDTSGRRSALARWLTDPRNPLTARVMVNRIWQGHFGRGLVHNANDFGTRTGPPSHPKLLDWLAAEFVAQGWSIKAMHRLIMTSAVYRQATYRQTSGEPVPRAAEVDSENRLYWHYPRRRLLAESIRDSMLAVAGRLNGKMYGPGIKPQLPPNFSSRHAWKMSESAAERDRRSVYIFAKRNLPYPLLRAFDFPDMHESCARRPVTTIAPQSLMLLNSELVIGFARDFAARVIRETESNDFPTLVHRAYRLAFGREPVAEERRAAVAFITGQQTLERQNGARLKAVVDFCHALLNANEFVYLD